LIARHSQQTTAMLGLGDISRNRDDLAACTANLARQFIQLGLTSRGDNQTRTGGGQLASQLAPDPAG